MRARRRGRGGILTVVILTVVASSCGGSTPDRAGDPASDKLAQVIDRGTLILSTDLDYAPQSYAVENAERAAPTACTDAQLTGPEVSGYDAEVGKAVADAFGVEPCFVAPSWIEITSGSWGDRWDLAFGSGAIDTTRMENLYVTQPYYVLPAHLFVPAGSTDRTPEDLSGKAVGACAACTHESYLVGTLELPGYDGSQRIHGAEVVAYTVEGPGLIDTARGEIDGFLCAEQVGRAAIRDGLELREIDDTLFVEFATGWVDRRSELHVGAFVRRVNEIVRSLHEDGTLGRLSTRFFGTDYAADAANFGLASIDQEVP